MRNWLPWTWGGVPGSFFRDPSELHRDFDESVFGSTVRTRERNRLWWPSVETHTVDGKLLVRCDLPGVDPKDIDVSLEGDTLTISGERRADTERREESGYYSEFSYGRFERSLRVPEGCDPEKVTARYDHGVLEITVPLPKEMVARKVPIQIEGPEMKKVA